MNGRRIRLVVFDLDGTLVRGDTICEAIARPLGWYERAHEMEQLAMNDRAGVSAVRREMLAWYRGRTIEELCAAFTSLALAPGALEGFRLLKEQGITTAIASMTWEFAVEWYARQLGADHFTGTQLTANGDIAHVWPEDKARWVVELALWLGIGLDEVAAVGDSSGDVPMLRAIGYPYFVGRTLREELAHVPHYPEGNIYDIAQQIVGGYVGKGPTHSGEGRIHTAL